MEIETRRCTPDGRGEVDPPESDEELLSPVDEARSRANAERREVAAEVQALEAFRSRVSDVEVARTPVTAPPGIPVTGADESACDRMGVLRDAYRETVMDVEHYDRVYGEPLEANVRAEFGPDIVNGVCEGGNAAFTEQFKRALLVAIERNRRERESFLDAVDRELDSLAEAESALREALGCVSGGTINPAAAMRRFDSLVSDRQRFVHTRVSLGRADGHDLCSYLYADEPWTYPVLYATVSVRRAMRAN